MPGFFENLFGKAERISSPEQEHRESPVVTLQERTLEEGEKKKSRPLNSGANATVFVELKEDGSGVFKPKSGESRFHPNHGTLFKRERAAYLVDRFLGFNLVPTTVIRKIDGKVGSMQEFIPDAKTAREVSRDELAKDIWRKQLIKLWIFDYIIHSTDRHGGNFLIKPGENRLYAIDNGSSFNKKDYFSYMEFPDFPIPQEVVTGIERFLSRKEAREICRDSLKELLEPDDVDACMGRIEKIGRIIGEHGMVPLGRFHELT